MRDAACTAADDNIRAAIRQHWQEQSTLGNADEMDLRRRILFEVLHPEVALIDAILATQPFRRDDLIADDDDLHTHLQQQLARLVLGPVYDLRIASAHSTVGWARKMLTLRTQQWFRNHGNTLRGEIMDSEELSRHDRATEDQIGEIEELQERMHSTRGVTRERIGAAGVRRHLELPPLNNPAARDARDQLYRIVSDEPTRLHDALEEYLTAQRLRMPTPLSPLATLFAGWDFEDASRARRIHIDLVALVIRGDLSPLPRPSNATVGKVKWFVRRLSDEPHWVRLAVRLVDAWIDEHCSAINDWDGRSDFAQAEEDRRVRALQWQPLAAQAVQWPGNPLSASTTGDAANRLRRMVEDIDE